MQGGIFMKHVILLLAMCVVMVSVLSSAEFGWYSMTPAQFADFCRSASAQEVCNLLKNSAAWNDKA